MRAGTHLEQAWHSCRSPCWSHLGGTCTSPRPTAEASGPPGPGQAVLPLLPPWPQGCSAHPGGYSPRVWPLQQQNKRVQHCLQGVEMVHSQPSAQCRAGGFPLPSSQHWQGCREGAVSPGQLGQTPRGLNKTKKAPQTKNSTKLFSLTANIALKNIVKKKKIRGKTVQMENTGGFHWEGRRGQ